MAVLELLPWCVSPLVGDLFIGGVWTEPGVGLNPLITGLRGVQSNIIHTQLDLGGVSLLVYFLHYGDNSSGFLNIRGLWGVEVSGGLLD